MFKKNTSEEVKKIYFNRKKIYNEADYRIKCNSLKSNEIVKILNLYEKSEIKFKNTNYKYSIVIGENTLNILQRIKLLCPKTKKIALIVDNNVPKKFKNTLKRKLKGYNLLFLPFVSNEKNKSLNKVNYYLDISYLKILTALI